MMNADGVFVGQICHIEAAEAGGQRFNPAMSNEARRAASNLILMCYEHHIVTNNVDEYPREQLSKIKSDHESRFARPDRAMLLQLTDWTDRNQPSPVVSLARRNQVVGVQPAPADLQNEINEINEYIQRFRLVPVDTRRFLGEIALRMNKMRGSGVVREDSGGTSILISDVQSAYQLSDAGLKEWISQLESYKLGVIEEWTLDHGTEYAIRLRCLKSGMDIWVELAWFCVKTGTPIAAFTEDLDFARLDA